MTDANRLPKKKSKKKSLAEMIHHIVPTHEIARLSATAQQSCIIEPVRHFTLITVQLREDSAELSL